MNLFPAVSAAILAVLLQSSKGYADAIDSLDDLDAEFSGLGDPNSPKTKSSGLRLDEFRGYLAEEFRFYPLDRQGRPGNQQLLTEAEALIDLTVMGNLGISVVPWFLIDALDTQLLRFEPLEAYLSYDTAHLGLLAGQFIESWGIADTFNPLDVLNRRDFGTDLFDATVRGELGARVRWTLPSGPVIREPTFSIYAMPLWRKTEFPTDGQRFAFSSPQAEFNEDLTQGPRGIDRLLWGIRFDHILETSAFNADLQYLAIRGPSHTPLMTVQVDSPESSQLVPQYYGEWVVGGGLRAVPQARFWSKFTLKAELAYKRPYRLGHLTNLQPSLPEPSVPDDYFQMVAGFDRIFVAPFFRKDELTLTLEYAFEIGADDPASLFRPFDSDLAVRLAYAGGDFARSSLELRGIFDVVKAEVIAEAVASRQLRFVHKDLKLELGGRYLRPAPQGGTLLSSYPSNNSSLVTRLQFDF